jgi:hypothetical protein
MGLKIGVNLGLFKLDYELKPTEQEILSKLFRNFSFFSILTTPIESQYAGECIMSIRQLRDAIRGKINELSTNSGVAKNLMSLQSLCTNFITEIKNCTSKLQNEISLYEEKMKSNSQLNEEEVNLVRHYNRLAGTDLMTNTTINIYEIKPIMYQQTFIDSLAQFRGTFGTLVYLMAGKLDIMLPEELGSILPNINERGDEK